MTRGTMMMAGAFLLAGTLQTAAPAQTGVQVQARRPARFELTEEQRTQLAELRAQQREAADEARAELIRVRAEVQALQVERDVDLRALEQAMNRLSQLENALIIKGIQNARELAGVLTAEQRQQFGARSVMGTGSGVIGPAAGRMSGRSYARAGNRMMRPGRAAGNRPGALGRNARGWGGRGADRAIRPGTLSEQWRNAPRRMIPPAAEGAELPGAGRLLLRRGRSTVPPPQGGVPAAGDAPLRMGRGRMGGMNVPPPAN